MNSKTIHILITTLLLTILLSTSQAYSQSSAGTYGSQLQNAESDWEGASNYSLFHKCTNVGAYLTGSYANLPCTETAFQSTWETEAAGGTALTSYLNNSWWPNIAFPRLRELAGQLHAVRINNTQMMGTAIDGQAMNNLAKRQQFTKLKARKRNTPNEYSCVVASNITAISKGSAASNAMTKALKKDLNKRSSSKTVLNVHNKKWKEYCKEFHDVKNNNGVSGCSGDTDGEIPNGDIDIEGILFKDTIDMSNEHEYLAANALLRNLIQPAVRSKITKSSLKSTAGKESILKRQHLEAVRNVATNVVSSIISRRMSIPTEDDENFVKKIRETAGINASRISENPSYNELMLALTKERFLDPSYFLKVQKNPEAIKQEQTSIGSYINIQLNDIYKIQEQINILSAARTALRFNKDPKSSRIRASGIK